MKHNSRTLEQAHPKLAQTMSVALAANQASTELTPYHRAQSRILVEAQLKRPLPSSAECIRQQRMLENPNQ